MQYVQQEADRPHIYFQDDIGDEKVISEKYGSKVNGVTITQHVDVIEAHNLDFDNVTPGWIGRDGSFIFNPLAT